MDKKLMVQTTEDRKQWNFSKGGVNLAFALRIDTKQEMKDFVELLEAATASVKAQLATFKK